MDASRYEWDPKKDAAHYDKHGIAFLEAIAVFVDPRYIEEDSTRPEFGQELEDGTLRPLKSEMDWSRFDAMPDAEDAADGRSGPDESPSPQQDQERLESVPSTKRIRARLRLTQEQFAASFHLPLGTVRDWELGRREPDTAARNYLRLIEHSPELVKTVLKG